MSHGLIHQPINSMHREESGFSASVDFAEGRISYEKTVIKLARLGHSALTSLAEVQLQQAVNTPRYTDELLDAAEDTLSKRVNSEEMGLDLQAAIRLAQMPLYREVLGNPKFPDEEAVSKSYSAIIEAATTAANHHELSDRRGTYEDIIMFGAMAEASALLPAMRWSLINNLTSDWLPLKSFLADDLGINDQRSGFDMSVYIPNRKGRPVIGYMAQIKASPKPDRHYSRKIAVVNINPDLATDSEPFIKSSTIIAECQVDAYPGKTPLSTTRRLNIRTHKLLDILERAK